jgi:membrane protein implicated in regulation of membrane protease activity
VIYLPQNVAHVRQTESHMSQSTVWWLLAGGAVALELATGTFYLLMLSLGLVAAAVAAHLGATLTSQVFTAALVGGGSVAAWHWQRSRRPRAAPAASNRDVHMDIGEAVQVEHWNADGTASVRYRGAHWTAVLATPSAEAATTDLFRIKELIGNRLVIEKL